MQARQLAVTCIVGLVVGACATAGEVPPGATDGSAPALLDGGQPGDAGRVGDGGTTSPDGRVPDVADAASPPGADAAVSPGSGRYLDRCPSGASCASGLCVTDVGGSRFCSRSCTGHADCASEHFCAGGKCVPDDSGMPCSVSTPATCALGLCVGAPGGAGACTRTCATAAECPSGHACTVVGGSKVCVDIEQPCPGGSGDCATGLCLSVQGCTATCSTAADCPRRLSFLPPYTCTTAYGSATPICVPPDDIIGPDAAGAPCRYDASGFLSLCRSGACDDSAPLGPMCVQSCTAQGGCPPGLGCYPLPEGGMIHLVCERAGVLDLGDRCASGRECHSGLCDATDSVCTRLCADGLCPTGWTCLPVAGTGVAMCRP